MMDQLGGAHVSELIVCLRAAGVHVDELLRDPLRGASWQYVTMM